MVTALCFSEEARLLRSLGEQRPLQTSASSQRWVESLHPHRIRIHRRIHCKNVPKSTDILCMASFGILLRFRISVNRQNKSASIGTASIIVMHQRHVIVYGCVYRRRSHHPMDGNVQAPEPDEI